MDASDEAHSLVSSIPNDIMKKIFGDHVQITVKRSVEPDAKAKIFGDDNNQENKIEIEVEDYQHD
jgi:hypothetical protein